MRRPIRAQKPRAVGSGEPYPGLAGQNTQRPVITSSAGSSVIIASSATPTPMASTGPRPLVEFSSARVRASRLRITVPPLATIAGPARRIATRIACMPVLVPPQLLAVPGGQQQRVVRAGAEHQHVQDARALRVDGQPGVRGQQVDHRLGGDQRHPGGDHRQQPERRAPVGDQQQHDDHRQRGEEQGAVDTLERLPRVGRVAERARDVDRQALGSRGGDAPEGVRGGPGAVPAVMAEVDWDDRLDRLAVAGHERPGYLALDHARHAREAAWRRRPPSPCRRRSRRPAGHRPPRPGTRWATRPSTAAPAPAWTPP